MTIYKGDETNNTINGSSDGDFIYGYGGNDILGGLGGADYINGGNGNDSIQGGEGNDTLIGGSGEDIVIYFNAINGVNVNLSTGKAIGEGKDKLSGFENIWGSQYNDTLVGDAGDNRLYGDNGDDKLFGLAGNDYIQGGGGRNLVYGGDGNDTLFTGEHDFLYGENGNDYLYGGYGNARLDGGVGNDVIDDAGPNFGFSNATLIGGEGEDVIIGGLGKDNIILTESVAATDIVNVFTSDSVLKAYNFNTNKYVNGVDSITGFTLSNGVTTTGVDQIGLENSHIAENNTGTDGINVGIIRSHVISNGIISFDDANTYSNALTLSSENLPSVFKYLQNNLIDEAGNVAFTAQGNTYLYQYHGGAEFDTVVRLTGVTATNLNYDGLSAAGIHLVNS